MPSRDELRNELKAVIRAARDLSPDTDHHLADVFLSRLEGPRAAPKRLTLRIPGRLAAATLALAILGTGGPLAVHALAGVPDSDQMCRPTAAQVPRDYCLTGLRRGWDGGQRPFGQRWHDRDHDSSPFGG